MIRAIFVFTAFCVLVFWMMLAVIGVYEFSEFMGAKESPNKLLVFEVGSALLAASGVAVIACLTVATVLAALDPKSDLWEMWWEADDE